MESSQQRESKLVWIIIFGLATLAVIIPALVYANFGIYWAALAYFLTMIIWGATMPCTCMSGGLIFSIIAMPIFFAGISVPTIAVIHFVLSLFG